MKIPRVVLFFFLLAVVIRIGYGLAVYRMEGTTRFSDDWFYISYAKTILNQGIFVPDVSELVKNAHKVGPGFPLILAAMFAIFGENYLSIVILNVVVSALICLLIFYVGRELFDEQVGIFAAGWSCIYALFAYPIPYVIKDVWLAFLFPVVIYAFLLETKRARISLKSLVLALLFAFLIHMDERFFIYFPMLTISFLFLDSVSWRNGLRKAALFFAAVTVLMIPWLIRNYYVYGRPVILTVRTSMFTDRIFGIHTQSFPEHVWNEALVDSILLGREVSGLPDPCKCRNLQLGLRKGYMPHEFSLFERWYAESMEFWRPCRFSAGYREDGFLFEPAWSLKHNVSVGITYGALLPFFAVGSILIVRRRDKKGIFVLSVLLVHSVMHVGLAAVVTTRYRVYADAFIIVVAFYGFLQLRLAVMRMIKRTSEPTTRSSPGCGPRS